MLYDMESKTYRDLGVILRDQPNTFVDAQGRGTAITSDYQIARYDPQTKTVSVSPLFVGDRKFSEFIGAGGVHPDWRIAADGKTAYLQLLNDLRMFKICPLYPSDPAHQSRGVTLYVPRFMIKEYYQVRKPFTSFLLI